MAAEGVTVLDRTNLGHLRMVRELFRTIPPADLGIDHSQLGKVTGGLEAMIGRLDLEAQRRAGDLKMAEDAVDETADAAHVWSTAWRNLAIEAALAAIRAERARQKAGQ